MHPTIHKHFRAFMLCAAFRYAIGAGDMCPVPAGPFMMGCGDGDPEEAPPHRRDLPAFLIDRCEVTNEAYAEYLAATGAAPPPAWNGRVPPPGAARLPVTAVTWFEAMEYACWAGARLPTEAEWEKAVRGAGGRRFPWGDEDDASLRAIDTGRLEAVGSRPGNASPCGALDLSGNAWEWTADWYAAYPGAAARSIHFGSKYKVVRGGGAEYLYGIPNRGDAVQRARLPAYGGHDFVGFRCVRDIDPVRAPYDPRRRIAEARALLAAVLAEPSALSYEDEYARMLAARAIPLAISGEPGCAGPLSAGIPLARGALADPTAIACLGPDGLPRPIAGAALVRWGDGSVRWLRIDTHGAAGETCTLAFGAPAAPAPSAPYALAVSRSPRIAAFLGPRSETLCAGVRLAIDGASALAPESFATEETTRLRTAYRVSGRFGGAAAAFRYDARIIVCADSARARILLTITHGAPRAVEAPVRDVACAFELDSGAEEAVAGTERGAIALPPGGAAALTQLDDLGYRIAGPGGVAASGTRAPGWIAARTARGWTALGVRHFWQNHPKALFLEPRALGVRLWTGDAPLTWEGGLAKTHEIVLDFGAQKPDRVRLDPLRASAPPAWVCGTQALGGPLLPRCREALDRFPYYEALRETGMRRWVRAMPFGFRHFGDAYLGGPWKGKNAYANLEYDVHFNFLLEHLRTGDPWYLSCAEAMARHQADIDTDHVTGQPWKHGPDHTTTEAELGHVFVRGLLLHYALTGETRSMETACRIGDWIASKMPRADDFNNERWVGWSLHALAGLFETTREERYLAAARAAVAKLCAGQAPSGKLPLRYDNRIAFFNGIAMQGMLDVHDQTGDPAIAKAVARIAHRTFGLYPDYACRTLNAYARLARLTPDPRYLDTLGKTWESSMAFLMPRDAVTAATYAWQFPHAAARHGLLPLFDREPPPALSPAGWRAQRLPQGEIECYLRRTGAAPASILVILEGPATGAAALWDPAGRPSAERRFSDDARLFQPWTITLPGASGACRLRLVAESGGAWQIHHDAAAQIAFHDPKGAVLPWLFPAAAGFVREGATEVRLTLEAMGEGFHTAAISSAACEPLAALRRFVDRDDKGRYELVLAAPAGPPIVRIDVALANVIAIEGLLPYFAASPEELFNPERELRR